MANSHDQGNTFLADRTVRVSSMPFALPPTNIPIPTASNPFGHNELRPQHRPVLCVGRVPEQPLCEWQCVRIVGRHAQYRHSTGERLGPDLRAQASAGRHVLRDCKSSVNRPENKYGRGETRGHILGPTPQGESHPKIYARKSRRHLPRFLRHERWLELQNRVSRCVTGPSDSAKSQPEPAAVEVHVSGSAA